MSRIPLTLIILPLTAIACASGGVAQRVPAELVQAIPEADRNAVETKTRHVEDAQKALATAEDDRRGAEVDFRKAELGREITVARIDANNEILEMSQKVQGGDRAVVAAKVGTALEALVEADDAHIEWREESLEYATVSVELAKARVVLADAELESARADAVAKSSIPGKEAVVLSEYKLQVSEHLETASSLEANSSEEYQEAEEARKAYETAFKKVPAEASEDRAALVQAKADLAAAKDGQSKATQKVDDVLKQLNAAKQDLTTCEQEKAEAVEAASAPVPSTDE